MKRFLQFRNIVSKNNYKVAFILFFLFSTSSLFSQDEITVNRTVVENPNICNQYDVELEIIGNPNPRPAEVVLVIDRSGSMGYDIPNDPNEPIDYAIAAAKDFVENLFDNDPTGQNKVAIVSYSSSARIDIGLTGIAGKQDVLDEIDDLFASGNTNIQDGLVKADNVLTSQGNFDCNTSRSIVLLTDGIANRDNSGNSCSNSGNNTICQQNAIQAGINAQTTTVQGEVYNQNIFSVGLFGALSNSEETAATNTINQIQNAGLFITDMAADLTAIYNTILGQLTAAATALPGEALVTNTIEEDFDYVPGSISANKGTTSIDGSGNVLSWFVNQVTNETITLNYSIVAVGPGVCGKDNDTGNAIMRYINSECEEQMPPLMFNNPLICVPCPEVTADIEQESCGNTVTYDANLGNLDGCDSNPITGDVTWEFFLNNISVGTSNTESGTFTYNGSEDFEGDFRAEVSFVGGNGTGCTLPEITDTKTIVLFTKPTATATNDGPVCYDIETLTLNETGGDANSWSWTSDGSATFDDSNIKSPKATGFVDGEEFTVTITDDNGCTSTATTTVTVYEEPTAIASNNGPVCYDTTTITLNETGVDADSWSWTSNGSATFNDSTSQNPTVTGFVDGEEFTVTITDSNGCTSTDTTTVTVYEEPTAIASNNGPVCYDTTTITLNETGVDADSWSWTSNGSATFNDSTSQNPTVTGFVDGEEFTVTITDSNGCTSTDTTTVTVYEEPTAIASNNGPVCYDTTTITLNETGVDADSWSWTSNGSATFNDSTSQNPTVTGFVDGEEFTVTITDSNGCTSTDTTTVTVYEELIVEAGSYGPICDNADQILLTGEPTNSKGEWTGTGVTDNGDGTASFDPSTLSGTITVTYTYEDDNQCSGSDTAEIVVNQSPDAPISSGDIAECKEETIQTLDANDAITAAPGTSIVWYTDATGNTLENNPTLNTIDSVTYYAEAVSDTGSCSSSDRTPVTLTIYNCSISIEKTASPNDTQECNTIAPGEMITYTFKVKNLGDVAINNVEVNDPLFEAPNPVVAIVLTDDGDGDAILDEGEEWSYEASYTVTQQDIINGQVDNTATVDGTVTGSSASFNVTDSDSVTVNLCQNAEISIVKSSTSESTDCLDLEVDDTIEYKFVVKNEGDVDITDVVITDPLFEAPNPLVTIQLISGDDINQGVLDVGEEWTYEATYEVDQDNINDGQVENTATVNGTTGLGPVNDTSNTITIPICQNASIALIKESDLQIDPNTGCYGGSVDETINYTFKVKNTGDVTLTEVMVTDLVGGVTMIGGPIASLAPGAEDTTTFTAEYTLTQADIDAGEFSNRALATGTPPQGDDVTDESDDTSYTEDGDTVVPLCQNASIALIKESDLQIDPNTGCYGGSVDETINYTFKVKNTGDVTLTEVMVTDLVGGVTMIGGPIASLAPGAEDTTTFTAEYTLTQADIDAGEFSNRALATGTPPQGDDVTDESDDTSYTEDGDTVVPLCQNASIALIKESDLQIDPNTGCYGGSVDETINYTFKVKNTGDVTLTEVMVTDLVGGVTMIGGPIASLAPGAEDTTTFTAEYTLTQADIDAGEFSNRALATGTPPQGDDVTDESDDTSYTEDGDTVVPLCQNASIALIKESDLQIDPNTGCYGGSVDETINYTFKVKNTGDVTLTEVMVTDLVGGVTMIGGPIASLAPGAEDTTTFTAEYTLTQADIDAGEFSNRALATGTPPQGDDVTDESDDTSYTEDGDTVVPLCQNASIALIKESDLQIDPNTGCYGGSVDETINYTFKVKNTGDVTLTEVMVTDLVGGVTMIGGPIASLAPGAEDTTTFTAEYTLTQADIDAGEFSNRALATGTPPQGDDVTDESDDTSYTEDGDTVVPLCQNASIALIKESDLQIDPNTGCYGGSVDETINYTFKVKNTGDVTLTEVMVTDLVGGVTMIGGPIASLAPGAEDTTTFTAEYTLTQADIDAGEFSNRALATGTPPQGDDVTDESDDTSYTEDGDTVVPLCQNASIALIKESDLQIDPNTGCYGGSVDETINYTFKVKNTGDVTLTEVMVTDLVGGVTMIGGPIASLAPGAEDTTTFTAEYTLTQADIDAGEFSNRALATGTPPQGDDVTDESDDTSYTEDGDTVVPLCQNASIALIKESDLQIDPNTGCYGGSVDETINYTFKVKNTGDVTLTEVMVTDLVGGVTMIGGPIASLAPGAEDTTTFTAEYTLTQADIDAGEFSNRALATGTPPQGDDVTDESDDTSYTEDGDTVVPLCQNASIALIKESDLQIDPNTGCYGGSVDETINYTFKVKNTGDVTLTEVMVTDLVGGVTMIGGPIASLAPGAEDTTTFTAEYTLTQADIDAGEFSNRALATGTPPQGDDVTDESDDTSYTEDGDTVVPLCQNASIALIKESDLQIDPNTGCYGGSVDETINYTFKVKNTGDVTLTEVMVTDLVGGVTMIGGPIASLAPGAEDTTTFTAEYTLTQADIDAGEFSNRALATGTPPQGDDVTDESDDTSYTEDGDTVVPLCQNASIALIKESDLQIDPNTGCYGGSVDETINYTFKVKNTGDVTLTEVMVTDLVGGVTMIGGPIASLAPGAEDTTTFTAEYTLTQADIDAGEFSNRALATGTPPQGDDVTDESDDTSYTEDGDTVVPLCQDPIIAIVKESSYDDGGDCSQPEEEINYTFTVTNQGNVSLSNVSVIDPLIATITGPTGDTDGDGELDVTGDWEYTGVYVITQDDIDNGQVDNQATAEGEAPDGTIVDDASGSTVSTDEITTTTLCQSPAIAIVKTGIFNDEDQDGCSDVEETISYSFTVTNAGNVSLDFVSVSDPLIGGDIPGPDSGDTDGDGQLDVTETWEYTAIYSITQDDIDAGEVVNQAKAKGQAPSGDIVTDDSGTTVNDDDPTVTTLCQNADIAIVKTGVFNDEDGDGCSNVGETISYTFTVTNQGNVSLSNVSVIDPLIATITGPTGDTDGDGELDVTETWTYNGDYTITQTDINTGQVVNQATAEGTAPDGSLVSDDSGATVNDDDPTVTVLCQDGAIALVKIGTFSDENGDGCTQVGETIVYDFIVTNIGIVDLTNVIVTDPLVTVNGGPISLISGATDATTFTAVYTVTQEDIDAGEVVNQATVEGTTPEGDIVSDLSGETISDDNTTITVLCQDSSMSLEKSGVFNDENGDGIPQVDETVSYIFSVTNTGNVTLYNITIEDPLPGIDIQGGPIDSLEPGVTDNTTFTATYAITQEDINAGQVINQAIVNGEDGDGTLVTDESDDPNNDENVDNNGDGEPDDPTVVVLGNVLPDGDFEIFNGITPNGDNLNDYFVIAGIQDYSQNNVKIYNRWGVLVWETDNYGGSNGQENVFTGESNARATIRANEELPTGTYFYILSFPSDNPGKASYSGYLYINR